MAEPSGELRAFRIHALALSFVLLLSSLIILPSASYFFQGDSLYWLEHRYQSWSEVAQAFVSLDSHGWYRPLSHRFIPSLFFPIFGMDPGPYHLPVFGLFLLVCLVSLTIRYRVFLPPTNGKRTLRSSVDCVLGYRVFLRLTGSARCGCRLARPYFVHSRWAPPPSAVCLDRPASGSTPGSSRSRHGWCCGACGDAPAVWRRWAAASKARPGFRDIGPDPCNNALLVELRPILHIHLYPQTSKRFHLRFHLGRADHSERVK